jgi:hypothetical protein
MLDEAALGRIGIWEDEGRIVGVAHYESTLGEAFFEVCPGYEDLRFAMLDYAEDDLYGVDNYGRRYLQAFVNDFDAGLETCVCERGYVKDESRRRPMSQYVIPQPFPRLTVTPGFRLLSLAEENDLRKIHWVLWRGFNHPGDPPDDDTEGLAGRAKMQSGPRFRKDLTIVVASPDGAFVSFCGTWFDATNRIALVEPVATDRAYRRLGLGRAAVLEGVRRCGALGATVAYVGSDQPFYQALGFHHVFTTNCWTRVLDH